MGADNWTTCSNCAEVKASELQAATKALRDSYGKVPLNEFDAARERLHEKFFATPPDSTWREDYEIFGANEGTVQVNYKGGCTKCKHSCEFQHFQDI